MQHPAIARHGKTFEEISALASSWSILTQEAKPKITREVKIKSIADLPNPKTEDCYKRLLQYLRPGEVDDVQYKVSPRTGDKVVVLIRAWRQVGESGGDVGNGETQAHSTHTLFKELDDASDFLRIDPKSFKKREKWHRRSNSYTQYIRLAMHV